MTCMCGANSHVVVSDTRSLDRLTTCCLLSVMLIVFPRCQPHHSETEGPLLTVIMSVDMKEILHTQERGDVDDE